MENQRKENQELNSEEIANVQNNNGETKNYENKQENGKPEKTGFMSGIADKIKNKEKESANYINNSNNTKDMGPLGFFSYLFILVILAIPVVNIIALIRWSIGRGINVNKRNLARAILCLSLIPLLAYFAGPFLISSMSAEDIGPSQWARGEIELAETYGLIAETSGSNYLVEITREEMIELAVKVYETSRGITAKPIENNPFSDSENENVLKAANLGIVSYTPEQVSEFRPAGVVTRQDMAVILLRTAEAAKPDGKWDAEEKAAFADKAEIADWAQEAINFAFNHEIIKAHENNIAPKLVISREEGVVCAKRVYEMIIN